MTLIQLILGRFIGNQFDDLLDKKIFYTQTLRTIFFTFLFILPAYYFTSFKIFFIVSLGFGFTELRVKTFINSVISLKFNENKNEALIIYRITSNLAVAIIMLLNYILSSTNFLFLWLIILFSILYC